MYLQVYTAQRKECEIHVGEQAFQVRAPIAGGSESVLLRMNVHYVVHLGTHGCALQRTHWPTSRFQVGLAMEQMQGWSVALGLDQMHGWSQC